METTRPPGFPGNPPARMPRAPTPARSPPPRPLRSGDVAFRPTHDVGPRTQCMSGLTHAAYGLPVNASRPGSPQAHASLGSGWRPTLAGWDWIPTGFRTRFQRSHHGILSPLTGLSRHTRWCMKDLLRGTSALQIEDGASRRRTYARHSWGNADWGRTYFRLLHVFSVDGRVTDPNAWSFQAAIVDPVDDVSAQLEQYRTGLFPLEQGSEGPFQWGDVHVVTYLPPAAQVFTVAARKAPEVPFTQTASLRIDGQLVGQHHFTDGQWHVLRYDLEARPLFRTIRGRSNCGPAAPSTRRPAAGGSRRWSRGGISARSRRRRGTA